MTDREMINRVAGFAMLAIFLGFVITVLAVVWWSPFVARIGLTFSVFGAAAFAVMVVAEWVYGDAK